MLSSALSPTCDWIVAPLMGLHKRSIILLTMALQGYGEWDFLRKPFHLADLWYISKRSHNQGPEDGKGSDVVVVSKREVYMGSAETVWSHFLFTNLMLLSTTHFCSADSFGISASVYWLRFMITWAFSIKIVLTRSIIATAPLCTFDTCSELARGSSWNFRRFYQGKFSACCYFTGFAVIYVCHPIQ